MSHELMAVTAAAVIALSRVEAARAIFLDAMAQHVTKPPNLKWQRRMAEMDRQRNRRRIRKVIEHHRGSRKQKG